MSNLRSTIQKVSNFCRDFQLLTQGDRLIIGISGGPDSVSLAHVVAALTDRFGLRCHLAHVNYGTRGRDSERDEQLCRDLADHFNWPLSVLQAVPHHEKATAESNNFQAWARQQRYDFFLQVASNLSAAKIVVAHQLTDQIETFLLRLLRGSGPSGLGAMRPKSMYHGVPMIRPLLCLTRQEILDSLSEAQIEYRLDTSNDSERYRRNLLRRAVLPQLRAIEPQFESQAGEALLLWQGEDHILKGLANQCLSELKIATSGSHASTLQISRKGLKALPRSLRLRVIREMIAELTGGPQSITFHHVRKIDDLVCQGPAKAQYDLPAKLFFEQGPLVVSLKIL